MRPTRTPLALALTFAVAIAVLLAATAFGSTVHSKPTAHASSSRLEVGIGDESPLMFGDPAYKALHLKIARYFTPYDVASGKDPVALGALVGWLKGATAAGVTPLIAFYHNESSPKKLPSVATYTADVKLFLADFPQLTLLQPWNEVNRGNVKGRGGYDSPSAKQSAQYYLALKQDCTTCTIVGLDVLDSTSPQATIKYINQFKRDVGKKNMPKIWGLHNYSDTNRFYSHGTRAVLADVPGQVWLTETGGLAKLSPSFKFNLSRQKRATSYMFKLADAYRRITRLYIYSWYGGRNIKKESFDAGLANSAGKPRPAYCVVYEHLLGKKRCPYKTARN
ncbi:MAG: hypothetical protein ABSC56_11800 [Solirubrobacteraceae bacterium]|jgi:hypothetical protein